MTIPTRAVAFIVVALILTMVAIVTLESRRKARLENPAGDAAASREKPTTSPSPFNNRVESAGVPPKGPNIAASNPSIATTSPVVPAQSPYVRLEPPADLSGWFGMTEDQRLDVASELQHNANLKPETVAFLKAEIRDRSLFDVTRNNIANALAAQQKKDPTLARAFLAVVDDKTEKYLWREYAVQHLANTADWSDDKAAMVDALWKQVDAGDGSIPGTALLHLHYLDQRGVSAMPNTLPLHIRRIIANEKIDISARMTCVGIVGQRRLYEMAPDLRVLADGEQADLRRVAVANLGLVGGSADLERFQRLAVDKDPLIAAAAKGAEKRLLLAMNTPTTRTNRTTHE